MTQLTLKQWMAVRDMTVLQFADAIGVSYPTVSNWRVGNTKPNTKYIPAIEKTLGIDYKDIIWTQWSNFFRKDISLMRITLK